MRTHGSFPLAFGLGALSFALGLSTLSGCGKVKEILGMDKGADGGAMAAQSGDSVPSLDGFEGEIGLMIKPGIKAHTQKPIPPINLLVKNGKFRVDVPTDTEELKAIGHVYVVVAAADKKLFGVLDDKKEVVLIDLDKIGEQVKGMAPHAPHEAAAPTTPKPPPKIIKTGRKDTVAGYTCEDWDIIPDDGSKATACIAERGVSWFKFPTLGLPAEYAFMADLLDGRHFPLRFIGYEKDGTEAGRLEVTKLEQKPMAAQLFDIPAGYRTVDLQQAIQEVMASAMAGHGMPPGMAGGIAPGMQPGMPAGLPPGFAAAMRPGAHPGVPPKPPSAPTPVAPAPKHK